MTGNQFDSGGVESRHAPSKESGTHALGGVNCSLARRDSGAVARDYIAGPLSTNRPVVGSVSPEHNSKPHVANEASGKFGSEAGCPECGIVCVPAAARVDEGVNGSPAPKSKAVRSGDWMDERERCVTEARRAWLYARERRREARAVLKEWDAECARTQFEYEAACSSIAEVSDGGPLTHNKPAAQSRRSLH